MSEEIPAELLDAVEQQLASPQTTYVAKTLARLTKSGMDEAEAKCQIALCLGEEMDEVMRKRRSFNEKNYRAALNELPLPTEPEDD